MVAPSEHAGESAGETVPLGGDWHLRREFAVRSAGFPVAGLEAFGADESERLRAVAADPRFCEAVTWQNRAAVDNALAKLAAGGPMKPSRARGREEIVASYASGPKKPIVSVLPQ